MNIFFVSLGCDKNLVDSEMMITSLRKAGYQLTNDENEADVIVVNTCCFIGDAKEESINTLLSMAEYKETGKCKLLVAAGCLAQRYHKEMREEIPEVDIIIGTMGYEELVAAIEEGLKAVPDNEKGLKKGSKVADDGKAGGQRKYLKSINYLPAPLADRDSMTGGYYAYLKIAEGCDKNCSYCIIPKVRGKYRSVPVKNLLAQARHLVENGARELILVAQETTLYGRDLYGKKCLPELLKKLSELEELRWIRILYCYPEEITEELIQAIKRLPKVCHYLDIPIQHGADGILRRMGRRTNRQEIVEMVERLRREIPDIAIRTTLLTGFPGETEEDFEELKSLVKELHFERLGVFAYSQEEDTPAAKFPEQLPEELKKARRDELMELQQEIAFEQAEKRIGQKMSVMIEGFLPEEGIYVARSYMDAPEVDGYVFLESGYNLSSGDFVRVEITGAEGYDLLGEIVE